ncbi:MAG: hypothetical protein FWD28_07550 [Treponema sp.]|nr:hypothetical protein [Treponema sp.]
MKIKKEILIILGVILIIASIPFLLRYVFSDSLKIDNVSSVVLRFVYLDEETDLTIVDEKKIKELVKILNGHVIRSSYPACFFENNISLEFIMPNKRLSLYPALDGCPIMRISEENKYIDIREKKLIKLKEFLFLYGFDLDYYR